jgi:hypothetical protein
LPKYKSALSNEEQNPQDAVVPERIQQLKDLYKKNHLEYQLNQEDEQEKTFEFRRRHRPTTYQYNILSIYRVRDPLVKKNEHYFYSKEGTCLSDNDTTERSGTHTYGFAVEPIHTTEVDPRTSKIVPKKVREDPVYFYKWDAKEVAKLLEDSEVPCQNFYIGDSGQKGQGYIDAANVKAIKNQSHFLNGKFEDLLLLNEVNLTADDNALEMVNKAREQKVQKSIDKISRQVSIS